MSDPIASPPHPELLRRLRARFPNHPRDEKFWSRFAAEVGDAFRPEIDAPSYRDLIDAQLRYVVEGASEELFDSLRRIRGAVTRQMTTHLFEGGSAVPADPSEADLTAWLRQEVIDFEQHVMSQTEVGHLEPLVLQGLSLQSGKDLTTADLKTRSREFLQFLQATGEEWEALPNSLMQHVLRSFPERPRDVGFWQRIQQGIGFHYSESGIEHPLYVELLNLQIRGFGFQETFEELRLPLESCRQRLQDAPVADSRKQAWEDQLEDLRKHLRPRQFSRDGNETPPMSR